MKWRKEHMENTTKNEIVKNEESVTEVEKNNDKSQSPVYGIQMDT